MPKRVYTGHKDKDGKRIYEGDIVESSFTAPWDTDCWITLRFEVSKSPMDGRWMCHGLKSGEEDNLLSAFRHLRLVEIKDKRP